MGWRQVVFPLLVIDAASGAFSGVFVYDPAPGAGNLIASMAVAGTDPYGNAYPTGIASEGTGAFSGWYAALVNNELKLHPNPAAIDGSVAISTALAGYQLTISSPAKPAGDNPAIMLHQSSLASGISAPLTSFGQEIAAQGAVAIVGAGLEQWHAVTIPAGWTGSARVKIMFDQNAARFDWNVTSPNPNTSATAAFGAFPSAAYYPLALKFRAIRLSGGNFANDQGININVASTGPAFANLPTGVQFSSSDTADYPLD